MRYWWLRNFCQSIFYFYFISGSHPGSTVLLIFIEPVPTNFPNRMLKTFCNIIPVYFLISDLTQKKNENLDSATLHHPRHGPWQHSLMRPAAGGIHFDFLLIRSRLGDGNGLWQGDSYLRLCGLFGGGCCEIILLPRHPSQYTSRCHWPFLADVTAILFPYFCIA